MATRDGRRYVDDLLDSLVRQTAPPHELVVVDDASADDTVERLRAFARRAPFSVQVVRGKRRGHVETFLDAARRCTGDAIAFCDHDDVWDARKLEVCGRELEAAGAELVLHTTRLVDAQLCDLGRCWPTIEETRTVPPLGLTGLDVHAPGMAMVVRRGVLDVADFDARPPSRYRNGRQMLHDEWAFFLAGALGRIRLLAEPLVLYRQHPGNDSGGWVDGQRRLTLRPDLGNYRDAMAHTAACADYLERTQATDAVVAERLATATQEYRRMSATWSLRTALYGAGGRRARARLLRRLLGAGAYRDRAGGGFGRMALGKDLAAGVALRVTERG